MTTPSTRDELKEYCLRKLGKPVIDINVADEQLDDRIDEALQWFAEFHYDGVEKVYIARQIKQSDIDLEYLNLDSDILSVVQIFPLSNTTTRNFFDLNYQFRLNELQTGITSTVMQHWYISKQHIRMIENFLVGDKNIRFNKHMNRLFIDFRWGTDVVADDYLVIEAWRKLDPDEWRDVYDDIFLKRYTTALFKRQWGENIKKFGGVELPGGITLNGDQIWGEANEEIQRLEEELENRFGLPVDFMVG